MQPVLFISHGAGPLPVLNDPSHDGMNATMLEIKARLVERPDAIIVITAHWEGDGFGVYGHAQPGMLYDYRGFPPEAYQLRYPAPGSEKVTDLIINTLKEHKLPVWKELIRGYDHGVFVPLMLLYPEADIPVIPISLDQHLDPKQHIKLGEALGSLRKQNVLIIGSGLQFHNLPMMFGGDAEALAKASTEFTGWLDDTLADGDMREADRATKLNAWADAPSGKAAHPREEHLIPVHACYGATKTPVTDIFKFDLNSVPARCYLWR